MTILDPPIKENSAFYKDRLFEENRTADNDSSTTLFSKEACETTVCDSYSDKIVEVYSIKVKPLLDSYLL